MGNNLKVAISNRDNNLNLIKLVAALMVIVSHAYGFANGYVRTDWLHMITNGRGDLGSFAVYIFFFYSGLLVTMSIMKSDSDKRYWKRRIVRIYPSFIAVTLGIVFFVGPFITTLSAGEYFINPDTYGYLKNLVFLGEHNLPGVFVGNVYGRSVNGPIWTIRVELCCYVMCYIFYKMKLLTRKRIPVAICLYMVIAGVLGYSAIVGVGGVFAVIMPITMFFVGMVYAVFADGINLNGVFALGVTGLMVVAVVADLIYFASIVFLPYVLCWMAFSTKRCFNALGKIGACSYEIYLWGGFVGQLVVYIFGGNMSEYVNMALAIPVSVIMGYITNRTIEKLCR